MLLFVQFFDSDTIKLIRVLLQEHAKPTGHPSSCRSLRTFTLFLRKSETVSA
jgi:hypothetical protein